MTELLTAAQMRSLEAEIMGSGAVSGLELMERAGAGVVSACLSEWPELGEGARHAVVLCGPGNNGGDGFVIARLLRGRGWSVEVLFLGDASRLGPDAAANHQRWSALGPVSALDGAGPGARPDLLVDAVFGIGLSRPIPAEVAGAMAAVKARPDGALLRSVAVDCPSGFDVDRGGFLLPEGVDRDDLVPDLCVTFHAPKPGHVLEQAAGRALRVVDIGLPRGAPTGIALVGPDGDAGWYRSVTGLRTEGHKYSRGHVLVLGGGPGQGGAARMAARAALRAGAGLVTLGVPQAALAENAAQLNAVMLRPVVESYDLRHMLTDTRLRCVVLGPGLGLGRAREMVPAALWAQRATVLDADALSAFEDDPQILFNHLHAKAILTPHEGEFRRLFPDLSAALPDLGRIEATRRAAARAGCTVLLKGPATVIAGPGGDARVHSALRGHAAPWLATAGAGDVLAGILGGLMATQETGALDVPGCAGLAAWLHVEAARRFGPGLIAEDLPDALPEVFREMGL